MKLNRNSVLNRLLRWFYCGTSGNWDHKMPNSLCSYFWYVLLMFISLLTTPLARLIIGTSDAKREYHGKFGIGIGNLFGNICILAIWLFSGLLGSELFEQLFYGPGEGMKWHWATLFILFPLFCYVIIALSFITILLLLFVIHSLFKLSNKSFEEVDFKIENDESLTTIESTIYWVKSKKQKICPQIDYSDE